MYILPNGQPNIKKVRNFVYGLGRDPQGRYSLYTEWALQTHIVRDPFKYFKNKFEGIPNKYIRRLMFLIDIPKEFR